jgi:hypothetical protein
MTNLTVGTLTPFIFASIICNFSQNAPDTFLPFTIASSSNQAFKLTSLLPTMAEVEAATMAEVEAAAMGNVTSAVNSTEIPASRLKEIPALTETARRDL